MDTLISGTFVLLECGIDSEYSPFGPNVNFASTAPVSSVVLLVSLALHAWATCCGERRHLLMFGTYRLPGISILCFCPLSSFMSQTRVPMPIIAVVPTPFKLDPVHGFRFLKCALLFEMHADAWLSKPSRKESVSKRVLIGTPLSSFMSLSFDLNLDIKARTSSSATALNACTSDTLATDSMA